MNKKFQIFSSIYRGFIIKTFKAFNNLTKLNFSENSYRIASKINKELFSSSNIFQANYSSFTLAYALAKFNRNIFNTYFSIFNSLIFFENHNIIFNLFQNLDLIYSSSNDSHFNYHILVSSHTGFIYFLFLVIDTLLGDEGFTGTFAFCTGLPQSGQAPSVIWLSVQNASQGVQ